MARRYSGSLTIDIVYDDRDFYRTKISKDGRVIWRGQIRPPAAGFGSGVGYDSRKAIDKTAHAALSFADDELGGEIGDSASHGERGWIVRHISRADRPKTSSRDRASGTRSWQLWADGNDRDGRYFVEAFKDKGEAERRMQRLRSSHPGVRYTITRGRTRARQQFGSRSRRRARATRDRSPRARTRDTSRGRDQAQFSSKSEAEAFRRTLVRHGAKGVITGETFDKHVVIYPASTPSHAVIAAKRASERPPASAESLRSSARGALFATPRSTRDRSRHEEIGPYVDYSAAHERALKEQQKGLRSIRIDKGRDGKWTIKGTRSSAHSR